MLTPADVVARLLSEDATQPALTYYDDTDGPTAGERIELSRKVFNTWVCKAANALQEGFDVSPGSVVWLQLPAPHWRLAYWAFATWAVGATVSLDGHEGADVLITTDPDSESAQDADEVIAVSLAALARKFEGNLRSGVMDEAHEISSYGDDFTAWDEPEEDTNALDARDDNTTYADLIPQTPVGEAARTLVTTTDPHEFLNQLLQVWGAGGSVVMVRGGNPSVDDERMQTEGVTARA
ncbi:TIGR03089 family protein [Ornithinimicrobium sp. Arc0846-15]|nr:TIGR03089 family protein [Ornithinimicrobium laminariae]